MDLRKEFVSLLLGGILLPLILGLGGCDVPTVSTSTESDSTGAGSDSTATGSSKDTLRYTWKHRYDIKGSGPRTPPEVITTGTDSLVLFTGGGHLTAFRTRSGSVEWSTEVDPRQELESSGLIHADGSVYGAHTQYGSSPNPRKAISWKLKNGRERWTFVAPSDQEFYSHGFYDLGPQHFYGSGRGGQVFMIDRSSGELVHQWTYDARTTGLAYQDRALYLARYGDREEGQGYGSLAKVDVSSKDTLWTFEPEYGAFITMRPMLDEGRVYAGTSAYSAKGVFVALDQETGEVIWRNKNARVYWAIWAETPNGGRIFVNNGQELIALDPEDGDTLWRADMKGGHSEAGLAYLDGYIYHPHGRGLRVVDAETGEIVHVEWPRDGYFWEVGTGAGKVFAQDSGALYAFEPYSPE